MTDLKGNRCTMIHDHQWVMGELGERVGKKGTIGGAGDMGVFTPKILFSFPQHIFAAVRPLPPSLSLALYGHVLPLRILSKIHSVGPYFSF